MVGTVVSVFVVEVLATARENFATKPAVTLVMQTSATATLARSWPVSDEKCAEGPFSGRGYIWYRPSPDHAG